MGLHSFIVHGHFYQPPREDPLTGIIPKETGAAPFLNWNERIYAECYHPNAELGNFGRISFNMGPTLLSWMQQHDPVTTAKIIAQDRVNVQRLGAGNAIAQAYHHTILPLAKRRDKEIQIAWGIADFVHRFGRQPEGMWLPETAVDEETLSILARRGMRFTILAPWQAATTALDPSEPYRVSLPDGQSITVFFYQRELSGSMSFEPQITVNADLFAENILRTSFNPQKSRLGKPQVITLATDGELYGHHQQWRERFLARLVDGASSRLKLLPVYPALWLREYPVQEQVGIRSGTSWSCHHGIGRWAGGCGCTPGNGEWKARLRRAFNRLADEIDGIFVEAARPFFAEPDYLLERYIDVRLGRLDFQALVGELAGRSLDSAALYRLELLLQAQYERQRMFTSCGWFFEDLDRIEPRNNLAYAAMAIALTYQATGVDLGPVLTRELSLVVSQRTRRTAGQIFSNQFERTQTFLECAVH